MQQVITLTASIITDQPYHICQVFKLSMKIILKKQNTHFPPLNPTHKASQFIHMCHYFWNILWMGKKDRLHHAQSWTVNQRLWFLISGPLFLIFGYRFTSGSDGKESVCNVGDLGSIPGLEWYPRGGHGSPLQYSCLENPHGQRSLAGYSHGVAKSQMIGLSTAHTA